VRPATGPATPVVEISKSAKGPFRRLKAPRTSPTGYLRRGAAAKLRYRMTWTNPGGHPLPSRVAGAGHAIRYREKP